MFLVFLYGYGVDYQNVDVRRKIDASEMWAYRQMRWMSWIGTGANASILEELGLQGC